MEDVTYHVDLGLAGAFNTNQKEDGWTKSPLCDTVIYKEAQCDSGDLASILSSRSTGNKKVQCTISVANNEMIMPNSVEFLSAVTYALPDGSTDWVMTADGTVPDGTPASFKVLKPKANTNVAAITTNGIRPGRYCVQSQLKRVTVMLPDSGAVMDSMLDSNSKDSVTHMQNVLVDGFVNAAAVNDDGDPYFVNDMRLSYADLFGNFAYTRDEAMTSTNALIDARRIGRGDKPFVNGERVWHRAINSGDNIQVFSSMKDRLRRARALPPGMSLRYSLDVLDGSSRLETGLVCQMNTAASGQPAVWQDVALTLKFTTCFMRCQVLKLTEQQLLDYRSGIVLGSNKSLTDTVPNSSMHPRARAAKYTVVDLYQTYKQQATGQTGDSFIINSGDREILPQFLLVYTTADNNSAFSTTALHTSNWDCISWADSDIKMFQANTSGGQSDKAPFLDMYSNNDVNIRDPAELSIMGSSVSGQMFFRQTTAPLSTLFGQQLCTAVPSWVQNKYSPSTMAGRNCIGWYTDSSSAVVKDAATGLERAQLTVQVQYQAALTAPKALVCASFLRSDLVFDIQSRAIGAADQIDGLRPGYDLDRTASGAAMRLLTRSVSKSKPIIHEFLL
ncbi:MAG: hypothetical protein ACRCXX_10220 [Cetobacterium sp.]|uniref:hypothetical protein n=1 Tax=Cetobacterium sp. TaxID=2071632 RepID=UPI003F2C05C8